MSDLKQLQKLLLKAAKEMPEVTLKIIKVEGINFIKHNFRNEGFNTGSGINKWEERKKVDLRYTKLFFLFYNCMTNQKYRHQTLVILVYLLRTIVEENLSLLVFAMLQNHLNTKLLYHLH